MPNQCPGCRRSQWYVGRIIAECGSRSTAIPLTEARHDRSAPAVNVGPCSQVRQVGTEKRRFTQMSGEERRLELITHDSPSTYALRHVSAGGVMGSTGAQLVQGAEVFIRFEFGVLVPPTIKWAEDGMVGLAFSPPMPLDKIATVDPKTAVPNSCCARRRAYYFKKEQRQTESRISTRTPFVCAKRLLAHS